MRNWRSIIALVAMFIGMPAVSRAWDLFYDGSVMPNDPALGTDSWIIHGDVSNCSTDGDKLHVTDLWTNAYSVFSRFASPGNSPVTLEARVRVAAGDGTALIAGTPTFYTIVWLYSDRIDVKFVPTAPTTYEADLSQFRTVRIATDSSGQSFVWLDGVLLAKGSTSMGNQGDVLFGSNSRSGVNESYWDYVAYSNAFLPIPEPSSLLALVCGLGAMGFVIRKRK